MGPPPSVVAAVELGGSHALLLVGSGPDQVLERQLWPTTTPEQTLAAIAGALGAWRGRLAAVGVASFGPLRCEGREFVGLGATPKPGWSGVDLVSPLRQAADAPVFLDTDVNLAALGEHRWGAGRGVADLLYLTVGTGIGGGALVRGQRLHGSLHPEMGHLRLARLPGDSFPGVCSFHGDCWEGLASAPALAARWGESPALLPDDHPAWALQARLLAQGTAALGSVLAPSRVVLGGGVLQRRGLLEATRAALVAEVGGYGPLAETCGAADFLVAPALGSESGAMGALALALDQSLSSERAGP